MVQEEVRTSIRVNVNGALQKAVGEALSRQVSAGLQRSVESVVLAQLPKTVNRALQVRSSVSGSCEFLFFVYVRLVEQLLSTRMVNGCLVAITEYDCVSCDWI